jgi:hypothetical protein
MQYNEKFIHAIDGLGFEMLFMNLFGNQFVVKMINTLNGETYGSIIGPLLEIQQRLMTKN